MSKNKYKTSYGIALCRYNKDKNNQNEILMVKKRCTYYYCNFVFGYYNKNNNKQLQFMFSNMSFDEKMEILSMKFHNMWYRLTLGDPEKIHSINIIYEREFTLKNVKHYFRKKTKFENTFLRDNGNRLKRLINNSANVVSPWEIPKGGIHEGEKILNCAKREFEEETKISSDNYTILWDIDPITVSHKDDNIVYRSIYYIAYLHNNSNWTPKINFDTYHQVSEVKQVRWLALNEIKFLNLNETFKKILIRNYKTIMYHFKKKIKSYYYNNSV